MTSEDKQERRSVDGLTAVIAVLFGVFALVGMGMLTIYVLRLVPMVVFG